MPVQPNATFTFASYEIEDTGIRLHFVSPNPGPGQPSDYYVFCTDAELAAITTQPQLVNLVDNKLNRAIRAANIASKLDQFVGQSRVI